MVREVLPPYELSHGLVSTEEVMAWHRNMLRRMRAADQAAADYERRKPDIEEHWKKELLHKYGTVEDWQFRKAMGDSWVLNDLLKKHAWNRDEANRLNLAIIAQHALRQMLTEERRNAE